MSLKKKDQDAIVSILLEMYPTEDGIDPDGGTFTYRSKKPTRILDEPEIIKYKSGDNSGLNILDPKYILAKKTVGIAFKELENHQISYREFREELIKAANLIGEFLEEYR